jgi:hypothetical protein
MFTKYKENELRFQKIKTLEHVPTTVEAARILSKVGTWES